MSGVKSFPNWQRASWQPYIFFCIRQCFAVLMLSFYSLGTKQLFCRLSTWTETKEVIRRIGLFWIQHRPDRVFRINYSSPEKIFSNRGQAKQAHRNFKKSLSVKFEDKKQPACKLPNRFKLLGTLNTNHGLIKFVQSTPEWSKTSSNSSFKLFRLSRGRREKSSDDKCARNDISTFVSRRLSPACQPACWRDANQKEAF